MRPDLTLTCGLLVGLALGSQEAPPPARPGTAMAEAWNLHGQLTTITMGHGAFAAPYQGDNSFWSRREVDTSITGTLDAGLRLWEGGAFYLDPEIAGGRGNSAVRGVAGFPNGEIYRVDSSELKLSLARIFLRQTWDLGGAVSWVEGGANQLAGPLSSRHFTLTAGKFALMDVFDDNGYAHDPRTQFMNWALMGTGAWDYPADTKGYTWGIAVELALDEWSFRAGSVLEPIEANKMKFDPQWSRARGEVIELEHRHTLGGQPGKVRALGYLNRARMGSYREALDRNPAAPEVTATRTPGRSKYGWGFNLEQALGPDVGLFARLGWNDGRTETWAFTEIDRSLAVGLSVSGGGWRRTLDRVGIAMLANGLSADHGRYLAAGGYGFILGDGRLKEGQERILEAYYALGLTPCVSLSLDVQRVWNPACNRDRGPIELLAFRMHLQF